MSKPAPNLVLKRERLRQQMTRTMLAERTGLHRKSLLEIEERKVRPRFDSASRIAAAFDDPKEITDLFTLEEVIG